MDHAHHISYSLRYIYIPIHASSRTIQIRSYLAARQKEIIFSKLYEKELESYESLSVTLSSFIDSLFALTAPLKQVASETPGIVSNDDVRNLVRELSTEVNKALVEFYTKLEARKLYLPPEVYDDARKLRDHLRNLANEYVITSEYPSPDPKETIKWYTVVQERTAEATKLRDKLIVKFQTLMRKGVNEVENTTFIAFTRRPPFAQFLSVPIERVSTPERGTRE